MKKLFTLLLVTISVFTAGPAVAESRGFVLPPDIPTMKISDLNKIEDGTLVLYDRTDDGTIVKALYDGKVKLRNTEEEEKLPFTDLVKLEDFFSSTEQITNHILGVVSVTGEGTQLMIPAGIASWSRLIKRGQGWPSYVNTTVYKEDGSKIDNSPYAYSELYNESLKVLESLAVDGWNSYGGSDNHHVLRIIHQDLVLYQVLVKTSVSNDYEVFFLVEGRDEIHDQDSIQNLLK